MPKTILDLVADLNQEYALVELGNKMVVMEQASDGSIQKLWDPDQFHKKLIKLKVSTGTNRNGSQQIVQLSKYWLDHPKGRQHRNIVYAMPGSSEELGEKDFNGWFGFTVQPEKGSWDKNKMHLHRVVCGGSNSAFEWVMNWLAALFQAPGRHAMTSIVLMGDHGVGKGHFADKMVGACFHKQQYAHLTSSNQLTGDFHEHLSGKAFIFADEATWGGDPRAAGVLKALITEDTVAINRKNLPMVFEPSCLHIIIASNNDYPVRIERTDRRFTILEVSDVQRNDHGYFGGLHEELNNGGRAAMLFELLNRQVNWGTTRLIHGTKKKAELAVRTMKPVEHWWQEKLRIARLVSFENPWPDQVLTNALHEDYMDYVKEYHHLDRTPRSTMTELGVFLKKMGVKKKRNRTAGEMWWHVPPVAEARATWEAYLGLGPVGWDTDDEEKGLAKNEDM